MMNLTLILSHLLNIQRKESYLYDFIRNFNVDLCSDINRLISFKFGVMIEIAELYILI